MDPLLVNQLADNGLSADAPPPAPAWQTFLTAVSTVYTEQLREREQSLATLQRNAAEMAENLSLVTAIQETVAEAIMVVGTGGQLLAMNGRFREMCKLPPELATATRADAILEHLKSIVTDPESLRAMVRTSVLQPGAVYTNDIELKDGRTFERYVAPVIARDGTLYGRLICYRDATLRVKHGKTLEELAESGQRLLAAEREASRLARQQAQQLEREFAIASQIQASILPRSYRVVGFDIAGTMIPADTVGGDYYDIIPTADGAWLGIGDVSGHGLTAGLVMMMTQCAVGALVRRDPDISPVDALVAVNEILVENIRRRLRQDEHMTLTLLRLDTTGRVRFAGAHEELMVFRGATRTIEHLATPGAWVGMRPELHDVIAESSLTLSRGDVLVLYTDGIIEARHPETGEEFGIERLADAVRAHANLASQQLCEALVRAGEAWAPAPLDDRTVVVIRM